MREVKVKIVSAEKKHLLQHELDVLSELFLADCKFFVKPLYSVLIPSFEFTVSDFSVVYALSILPDKRSELIRAAADPSGCFDNHVAMVLEKGEINLTDYLHYNRSHLTPAKLADIIDGLVGMVTDAHKLNFVLMDIKDQNVVQFKIGPGLYSWKGIDLDGSLRRDTLLRQSNFMATIRFMAPELLSGKETRARFSLDIWSLGVLIFNTLISQQQQTLWSLLGIHGDDAIKEEVVSGRLSQEIVDGLIKRTFPSSDESSKRRFLERMLKIKPSERWTIESLQKAALLKGISSISGSMLYEGQKQILSEVKALQELVKMGLVPIQTALDALLDDDDNNNDLGHINASLNDLQALLVAQAQSTVDFKAAIESLARWGVSASSAAALSDFMETVKTQLRDLLNAADNQIADAQDKKDLMLELSNEMKTVQQHVQQIRDDIGILQANFVQFGAHVREELRSNASDHREVLSKMNAIDVAVQELTTEQEKNALKETYEHFRQMLVGIKQDTAEMDKKIDGNRSLLSTLVNDTHGIPTLMVLLPELQKGIKKYDPRNLCRNQGRLVFICAETLELVQCGKNGKGYHVNTLSPWVKNALPVLKVGLMLLQVGLFAAGLPIPLAGIADAVLPGDKHSFLHSAVALLPDSVPVDSLSSEVDSERAKERASAAIRALQAGEDKGHILHAYKVLHEFLKEKDPTLMHLGMRKVVSRSGRVGWVKNDPIVIQQFIDNN